MHRRKITRLLTTALLSATLLSGCAIGSKSSGAAAVFSEQGATVDERLADLDRRYAAIQSRIEPFGEGGKIVLDVAYNALREGKAQGKWSIVGIEDLWAESIKEGASLFNRPDRRWGKTTAAETKDMIGQTTIGPWQITVTNVKSKYGLPYGVKKDWTDTQVYEYCRDHPKIQAQMISDYIQEAYTTYGRRGPYGIQRYFWLEAYVKGEIGQGAWDKSVLPTAPDGDWKKLTPEMKADTGFYARQLVCGNAHNPYGLLYWLAVTEDAEGARDLLRTWRDQKKMRWDPDRNDAVLTDQPGNFTIRPEDLKYLERFPSSKVWLTQLIGEVLAEKPAP